MSASSRLAFAFALIGIANAGCELRRVSDLSEIAAELANSGQHLKDGGVESVYEIFYGNERDWALAVVPTSGYIAPSGMPERKAVLAELEKVATSLKDEQYLVGQIDGQRAEIRTLPAQGVRVDRAFVVVGQGPTIIEARVRAERSGPPRLISFEAKVRPQE